MLSLKVNNNTITVFFNVFTSVCMLTAFLGVSLCLYSFLADGLKMRAYGKHGIALFLLTFVPPLILVIYYPGAYIHALSYAGIFCIVLLLLLPALMCYFGRKKYHSPFVVPGNNVTVVAVLLFSVILLAHECYKLILS